MENKIIVKALKIKDIITEQLIAKTMLLEQKLFNNKYTINTINELVYNFSIFIESYTNLRDPVALYFKEKIHSILTNKNYLALYTNDNIFSNSSKKSKIIMNPIEYLNKIKKFKEEECHQFFKNENKKEYYLSNIINKESDNLEKIINNLNVQKNLLKEKLKRRANSVYNKSIFTSDII